MKRKCFITLFLLLLSCAYLTSGFAGEKNALVLMTDFGTKDAAVCSMKGVAFGIDSNLPIFDLTHEITAFDIWEGAYRLQQCKDYWHSGTIFVGVVDPGVGTDRKSIVLKTKTGKYYFAPDNGLLTLIADDDGISEVRKISDKYDLDPKHNENYTFYGRDVFVKTAALFASGKIKFEEIGDKLTGDIIRIKYQKPAIENGCIHGNIPILDADFGNVWTNIDKKTVEEFGIKKGDTVSVVIYEDGKEIFRGTMPYVNTFGDVKEGSPLAYLNSLMNLSFALNMDNFAKVNKIAYGPRWSVKISKNK